MTFLRVCVALCSLLALSEAGPVNTTGSHQMGRCHHMMETDHHGKGGFIPQCDSDGNFLPQQCCSATGYCWCVNIITGEELLHTRGLQGNYHYDCVKKPYCPYDWYHFGSQCFKFIDTEKMWIEAEKYCCFEGGHLASVHSFEENHAVQSLTRGNTHEFPLAWLGGQDAIKNGFYMWNDGTEFDYENLYMDGWHTDRYSHENCLLMNYGFEWKWHNAACNESLPFVCSKSSYYYH